MTKISNQRAYIPDEEINGLDYLPGTDFDQALKTVNFRVQDLGTHYNQVNGVRNFDFNFYQHVGSNPKPSDGYFYSNSNEQDPNNITHFIFSKKTARHKDVSQFFESISVENPFDLIISQKTGINTIFFFKIDSIETFSGYYKINVSEVFFPENNELTYTLSYAVFNLKSQGGNGNQNLQQVTDEGNTTTNGIIVGGIETPLVRLLEFPFEVDLKAEGLTATRELFAPDEDGTIATREWVDNNLPTVPSFSDQTETNEGVVSNKTISPNTLSGWWVYVKGLAQTFAQKITFNLGAVLTPQTIPSHERGHIYFDDANDCLAYMDSISGTSVQVSQEALMRARNNTGSTILNGSVVYISGAIGQYSTIALAQANSMPSSEIIGIATHDIPNNTIGKVCVFGQVNDVNSSAFNDGDSVFLSSSVAGELVTVPPVSPNYVVAVGIVEHAHPTQGKILVKPQRALANDNTLGTSQSVSVTQNAVKNYVDTQDNSKVDKVSTVDVKKVYTKEADGTQSVTPISELGSNETFAQSKWMYNDFYSSSNPLNREPFMGVAVNGGTFATLQTSTLAEHQGYGVIASGTNANGGFRMITNNSGIKVQAGLTSMWIISLNPASDARDRVIRDGFHTTTSNVAPTDGIYIEIIGSDLTFKATASSVTTASSTIALTSGINDLYEVMIYCVSASHVRCIVTKIGTGVVLDTDAGTPITTNIPTAGLNNGIVAHIVTAGANNNICQIDYGGLGAVCPTFLLDRL